MPLIQFGHTGGARVYDFTTAGKVFLGSYRDNFSQVDGRISRSPGMSGGYDEYGRAIPPTTVGRIRQSLKLRTETLSLMDAYRDELRALIDWGRMALWMRLEGYPTQKDRYCIARCVKVDMEINKEDHNLIQRADLEFEVSDPRWYVPLSGGSEWGVGEWGSATWGEAVNTIAASGNMTDTTVTHNGNTTTDLIVEVATGGSQVASSPRIQRLVGGALVEEVSFAQSMGNNRTLRIDTPRRKVLYNYANAFDERFRARTAGWLTLDPGEQTIRVCFDDSGDAATVRLYYNEAYR